MCYLPVKVKPDEEISFTDNFSLESSAKLDSYKDKALLFIII